MQSSEDDSHFQMSESSGFGHCARVNERSGIKHERNFKHNFSAMDFSGVMEAKHHS